MTGKTILLVVSGIYLFALSNTVCAQQPTVFDAGVNRDGFKTYIVHGYRPVHHANTTASAKKFEGALEGLITGLDLGYVHANLIVSGYSTSGGQSGFEFVKIDIDNSTGKITYDLAITGRTTVTQIQYTLFVATKEKSPWPAPMPGPAGATGPQGPAGPQGPVGANYLTDDNKRVKLCQISDHLGGTYVALVPQFMNSCNWIMRDADNDKPLALGCLLPDNKSVWATPGGGHVPSPNCGWIQ